MPTQIPTEESQTFSLVLADATRIAGEGRVASGYHLLCAGRSRALRAWYLGQPWGRALAAVYEAAIRHYSEQYGALEPGSSS